MEKNITIAVLAALVIVFSVALVHTENQRYAMSIGMCQREGSPPGLIEWDWRCLAKTETRTGWWWHVFYAVKDAL
jgi:hypothetical protein